MALPTNVYELQKRHREMWLRRGAPREAWKKVSRCFAAAQKKPSADTMGRGPHRMTIDVSPGAAAGGPSKYYSAHYHTPGTVVVYEVPPAKLVEVGTLDEYTIDTLTDATAAEGSGALSKIMTDTARRAHILGSVQFWSDRSGVHGKGDGAYSVAGDVITFKNAGDALKFPVGSRIIFVDNAVKVATNAGELASSTRAFASTDKDNVNGYLKVIGRSVRAGTLTVHQNITTSIPTATNTDWIGLAGEFEQETKWTEDSGGNPLYLGPMHGMFVWNPITDTEAAKDLYGVQRSKFQDELTGVRVQIPDASTSPYEIIALMADGISQNNVERPDDARFICAVTAAENQRIINDFASRSIQQIEVTMGAGMDKYASTYSMGVKATQFVLPDFGPIMIVVDPYLTDSTLSRDQDRTYFMYNENDVQFSTGSRGFGWGQYAGSKLYYDTGSSPDLLSAYGGHGALVNRNPGLTVVASTRANS